MNNRSLRISLAFAASAVLAGCGVRTSYRTPTPPLPEAYSRAEQVAAAPGASTADLAEWWKSFGDPTLDSLVERALAGNLDVKLAQERVREARATRKATSATRQLPSNGLSGGYSDGSRKDGLFQSGFDSSYEVDLFGGARASVAATQADALAAGEAVRGTLVSVAAETAANYLNLREAQERLALSRQTLSALEESLRLAELRRNAGLVSDLDTARATAQAESTRAAIPALETQAKSSIDAIALLLGTQPASVEEELGKPGPLPTALPEPPIGLPSDLLRRRPDIRQAEQQISGSAARVGVAVSNLYPKFSLTTSGGGQSNALLNILSGAARLWSFGSSFSWGLLNYPATKANIDASKSREQQSMITYEKTVLAALRDVEDALTAYAKEKQRTAPLTKAAGANREALRLAELRYGQGLATQLDVLDAQRSLYSSQDAVVQNGANIATDLAALYKALGGGWK